MTVQILLDRLQDVKKTANGWQAKCPNHDDNKPSLSISKGDKKPVLIHCHAGCESDDVLKAVGLEWADISNDDFDLDAPQNGEIYYNYHDPSGQLVYRSVRKTPKGFYQQAVRADGQWVNSMKGVTRYLYRANELIKSDDTVFIAEGEKDVDRLRSIGLTSTTNVGGAGKWKAEYNDKLVDRDVVILPHNDKSGLDHANKVKSSIKNVVKSVEILALLDLPSNGGDVSDWLNNGGTKEKLLELVEGTEDHLEIICFADVELKEVRWLWQDRVPLGKISIFAGDPDLGKSFITLDMAARISTGEPWPDFPYDRQTIGSTLILSAEDDAEDTSGPRLKGMGADMSHVHLIKGTKCGGKRGYFDLNTDIVLLRNALNKYPDCRLITVDPVSAYLGKLDSHSNSEVRGVLTPLSDLAAQHGIAVVLINHLNKGAGANPMYRVMGSLAFTAASRTAWAFTQDKNQSQFDETHGIDRKLMLCIKNNLTANEKTALAYRLIDNKVEWEPDPIHITAKRFFAEMIESKSAPKRTEATQWLREQLDAGPQWVTELQRLADQQDMNWRTIMRAKDNLEVMSEVDGFQGPRYWRFKNQDKKPPEEATE